MSGELENKGRSIAAGLRIVNQSSGSALTLRHINNRIPLPPVCSNIHTDGPL